MAVAISPGMLATSLLVTALTLAASPPVEGAEIVIAKRNRIGLNLGVGSPVGFGGLTYDRDLTSRWQIEAGAGLGMWGAQLSVMPRRVWRMGHGFALFTGVGPSVDFAQDETPNLWANGEAGLLGETRRMFIRLGVGATMLLAGEFDPLCFDLGCDSELGPGFWMPTIRLTYGIRF